MKGGYLRDKASTQLGYLLVSVEGIGVSNRGAVDFAVIPVEGYLGIWYVAS